MGCGNPTFQGKFKGTAHSYLALWVPQGQPVTVSVALTFISRDRKEAENNELALPQESPQGCVVAVSEGLRLPCALVAK